MDGVAKQSAPLVAPIRPSCCALISLFLMLYKGIRVRGLGSIRTTKGTPSGILTILGEQAPFGRKI